MWLVATITVAASSHRHYFPIKGIFLPIVALHLHTLTLEIYLCVKSKTS